MPDVFMDILKDVLIIVKFDGMFKKQLLRVLLSGAWVGANEFLRNQVVLADAWWFHYKSMRIFFPSEPVNGAVWGIWSLGFAALIAVIVSRFSLWQSVAVAWFAGFVLMWLVIGNLGVLPFDILPMAIPWSLAETFGAVWIVRRLRNSDAKQSDNG